MRYRLRINDDSEEKSSNIYVWLSSGQGTATGPTTTRTKVIQ